MSGGIRLQLGLERGSFALRADLDLPGQGITVLFGPSGCGKTTLLRCVAGLEPTSTGRVCLGAEVWQDDHVGIRLPTWQRNLGYVFQEASLFEHLDVRRNLEFGLSRTRAAGGRLALAATIELLGIGHLLERRAEQLSGGERQRVAMARALATQPRLLLLDEPLAALDQARRQEIMPWLERLRDELSIPMLYVTHSVDELARLANHLVLMHNGHIQAAGPVQELMTAMDSPGLGGEEASTLLHARVDALDSPWHLARASFGAGHIWIRDSGYRLGAQVRLRVLARDVSVQLHEPSGTSIQNQLQAVVESITDDLHPSQAMLRLCVGESRLLARLTRKSVSSLGLRPGQRVWALVKSVAVIG
jgi:molybdate transport system ATP-binding protein